MPHDPVGCEGSRCFAPWDHQTVPHMSGASLCIFCNICMRHKSKAGWCVHRYFGKILHWLCIDLGSFSIYKLSWFCISFFHKMLIDVGQISDRLWTAGWSIFWGGWLGEGRVVQVVLRAGRSTAENYWIMKGWEVYLRFASLATSKKSHRENDDRSCGMEARQRWSEGASKYQIWQAGFTRFV